jgi:hypothetical protein
MGLAAAGYATERAACVMRDLAIPIQANDLKAIRFGHKEKI